MPVNIGAAATFKQVTTTPGTPPASHQSLYIKSDGTVATENSSGVEQVVLDGANTYKPQVKAATTASLTLSGAQTVDGVSLVAGDRILVKNQATPAQNGIYVVSASSWTRANDASTSALVAGANVGVTTGTVAGGTTWVTSFKTTDTLATTNMSWYRLYDASMPLNTLTAPTGQVTMNSQRVTNVAAPTTTTDAIPWQTLLDAAGNASSKYSVKAATTNGDGNQSLTGAATIDGVVLATGDRVLVKNQTSFAQNGIYQVVTSGTWLTPDDVSTSARAAGASVSVQSGTVNGGTQWETNFKGTDSLGGNNMLWYPVRDGSGWVKPACRAGTTATVTLAGGAPNTIDGVTLAAGDRILVKNQGTTAQNGIYVVATLGTGANGTWTRSNDTLTAALMASAATTVTEGSSNAGRAYQTKFKATDTLGTTGLDWWYLVDNLAGSLLYTDINGTWKAPVTVATTANITLSGTQTIDGAVLSGGERVLVKDQTTRTQNGIYVVAAGAWSRSTDADTSTKLAGATVSVLNTISNVGMTYRCDAVANLVLGTGFINWYQVKDSYSHSVRAVQVANVASLASASVTVDGVTLVQSDRVLLVNQTTSSQNGIYSVGTVTTGNAPFTRAAGYQTAGPIAAAGVIEIREGSVFGGTGFFTNFKATDTVDTTAMMWGAVPAPNTPTDGARHVLLSGTTSLPPVYLSSAAANNSLLSSSTGDPAWVANDLRALSSPYKYQVLAATVVNITLSGTQTVDSVPLVAGNRCLVKNQTTKADNGIYVVAAGAWTRATDADTVLELVGATVWVQQGATQWSTEWYITNWSDAAILGSSTVQFIPKSYTNTYTPAWTGATTNPVLNNGTAVGSYVVTGSLVWFSCMVTSGSTTTYGSGQYSFSGPPSPYVPLADYAIVGWASTGTNPWALMGLHAAGTATYPPKAPAGTAGNANVNMTNTAPATWVSGSVFRFTGTYRWV